MTGRIPMEIRAYDRVLSGHVEVQEGCYLPWDIWSRCTLGDLKDGLLGELKERGLPTVGIDIHVIGISRRRGSLQGREMLQFVLEERTPLKEIEKVIFLISARFEGAILCTLIEEIEKLCTHGRDRVFQALKEWLRIGDGHPFPADHYILYEEEGVPAPSGEISTCFTIEWWYAGSGGEAKLHDLIPLYLTENGAVWLDQECLVSDLSQEELEELRSHLHRFFGFLQRERCFSRELLYPDAAA